MVKGLRSLKRKMRVTIPDRVKRKARSALAVWADKTVASMEAFVPERTGELFASIGWVWGTDIPDGAISVGTISNAADPDLVITVFAGNKDAFYARWVEFGTVYARENPFFFPAVRLNRRGGRARLARAIRQGLKEGAK